MTAIRLTLKDVKFEPLPDQLLVPGSLILYDMAQSGLASVPVNNDKIDNLAWSYALDVISGSTRETLQADFISTLSVESGFAELTGKKGLHIVMSQTTALTGKGAILRDSALIKAYMATNPAHRFYISDWSRPTRFTTYAGNPSYRAFGNSATNYLFLLKHTSIVGDYDSGKIYTFPGEWNALGLRHAAVETKGYSGTLTPASVKSAYEWGSYNGANNSTMYAALVLNKAESRILYRGYIEDLTVSGRSFNEVLEEDIALRVAAFAFGGKYYNDTFTNPNILP